MEESDCEIVQFDGGDICWHKNKNVVWEGKKIHAVKPAS